MNYDITMCDGNGCPKKDACDRFLIREQLIRQDPERVGYHSYFTEIPYDFEKKECEFYMVRCKYWE
jgi:hypothetical protein